MFETSNKICSILKDGNISFILAVWGKEEKFYEGKFPCGFPNIMIGASNVLNNVIGGLNADITWALDRFKELCSSPSFESKVSFDVEMEYDLIHRNNVEILSSSLRAIGYSFLLVIPTRLVDGDFIFEVYRHSESITDRDKVCSLSADLLLQTLDPDVCDFLEALEYSADDIKVQGETND